ncbi:uncharacterized protein YALI1_C17216g [Yarrowia lipolytica]|uniref:Uncharacterized protein n=1 Tax=Yarrowia lipolytica TaxID=4952 RepID=A0A1D8NAT6_YARLL|nr:hypothetical protein YALI1_C17216g [Yarrowia lipolytica]
MQVLTRSRHIVLLDGRGVIKKIIKNTSQKRVQSNKPPKTTPGNTLQVSGSLYHTSSPNQNQSTPPNSSFQTRPISILPTPPKRSLKRSRFYPSKQSSRRLLDYHENKSASDIPIGPDLID